jgi:hypothetical protein
MNPPNAVTTKSRPETPALARGMAPATGESGLSGLQPSAFGRRSFSLAIASSAVAAPTRGRLGSLDPYMSFSRRGDRGRLGEVESIALVSDKLIEPDEDASDRRAPEGFGPALRCGAVVAATLGLSA